MDTYRSPDSVLHLHIALLRVQVVGEEVAVGLLLKSGKSRIVQDLAMNMGTRGNFFIDLRQKYS